ncbi:MAG: SH3 domain-containing protein [Rhizobiaceae bacterium]|nr:SH3 domain-containing protein [Rhizobiaceae bacterium]
MFNTAAKNKKLLSAFLAIVILTGVQSAAKAEGYLANYDAYVTSVEPWDHLNVRKWPAYYSQKVDEIPHDGQFVWVQRCIIQPHGSSSDWCKVSYDGQWGWVNKRFLAVHY